VIYCGTNAGQAWQHPAALIGPLVETAAAAAGLKPTVDIKSSAAGQVHVDRVVDRRGRLRFVVALNRGSVPYRVRVEPGVALVPVYADSAKRKLPAGDIEVPAGTAELYVVRAATR
jgi:pyruvate/2-oxoglutarate/acetoin dehydrogenase E1 component